MKKFIPALFLFLAAGTTVTLFGSKQENQENIEAKKMEEKEIEKVEVEKEIKEIERSIAIIDVKTHVTNGLKPKEVIKKIPVYDEKEFSEKMSNDKRDHSYDLCSNTYISKEELDPEFMDKDCIWVSNKKGTTYASFSIHLNQK